VEVNEGDMGGRGEGEVGCIKDGGWKVEKLAEKSCPSVKIREWVEPANKEYENGWGLQGKNMSVGWGLY
jgi:hypothetical protein